jgi:hypothetical protein
VTVLSSVLFNDHVSCWHYNIASAIDEWGVMEHRLNDTDRGRPKYSGRKLSQCYFVLHKSNMDWPGTEPVAFPVSSRRLTTLATARLVIVFNQYSICHCSHCYYDAHVFDGCRQTTPLVCLYLWHLAHTELSPVVNFSEQVTFYSSFTVLIFALICAFLCNDRDLKPWLMT